MLALAALCALIALTIDLSTLLELHDLIAVPAWLAGGRAQLLATVAKVALLAWLCRKRLGLPKVAQGLVWLTVALGLLAGYAWIAPTLLADGAPDLASGLSNGLGRLLSRTAGMTAFGLLVVGGWIYVAVQLRQSDRQAWRGYREAFALAALVIAIAMLLYFFDTPKLLGHLLFDCALLGLAAALWVPRLALGRRARWALYCVTLVVPLLAYVTPFFIGAGALVHENRERLATIGADTASVTAPEPLDQLLAATLVDYQTQQRVPAFNDIWLLGDGRALAITNQALWERQQPDQPWQILQRFELIEAATYIRFDRSGQRGVIGAWYGEVMVSVDGGHSWRKFDPFAVFQELSGREFGENLLDDDSAVYLDPDTGTGSFMMGCRFFTSKNFGESWRMTEVRDADGKLKCLTDSPFAVNFELGLASAAVLGSEYLLRRASRKSPWQPLCGIDYESFLVVRDIPLCDEDGVLSPAQKAFVANLDNENRYIYRQLHDDDVLEQLLAGQPLPEAGAFALRDNGQQRWLAGAGYLLVETAGGGFDVDYRVPALTAIAPLDQQRALGATEYSVFQTSDGGRVWRQLGPAPDRYFRLLAKPANAASALLRSTQGLARWDGGAAQEVLVLSEDLALEEVLFSTDGQRWLVRTDGEEYFYSLDGAASWTQHPLPALSGPVDEHGWSEQITMVSMDCDLSAAVMRCAAVFEDGTVLSWAPERPGRTTALTDVPLHDDYAWGMLALLGPRPDYIYLPEETSRRYLLQDQSWQSERTGAVLESWTLRALTDDRRLLAVQLDAAELLLLNAAGDSELVSPRDWDDYAERPDHIRLCQAGEMLLFNHVDGHLAVRDEQGWRQGRVGDQLGAACGSNGPWLWLQADGLTVYRSTLPAN